MRHIATQEIADPAVLVNDEVNGFAVVDKPTSGGLPTYYGGLHCGECFDVMIGGKWKSTRIEMGENWYLVGIRASDLSGRGGNHFFGVDI